MGVGGRLQNLLFASALLLLGAFVPRVSFAVTCASGFVSITNGVHNPSPECGPDPTQYPLDFGFPNGYPVCGLGRVPVASDFSWWNISDNRNNAPSNLGLSYTDTLNTADYFHLTNASSNPPVYMIPNNARCVCLDTGNTTALSGSTGVTPTPVPNSSSGLPKMYPDTHDVINSRTLSNNVHYSPVAAHKDSSKDGRAYAEYIAGNSVCACPNVNEITQYVDPPDGAGQGKECIPNVTDSVAPKTLVFPTYDPVVHTAAQVILPAKEPYDVSGTTILTQIRLPRDSSQSEADTYDRHIWTCANPFQLIVSGTSGTCSYTNAIQKQHACDDGTLGTQASAVMSPTLGPITSATAFNSIINKKLACCMNAYTTGDTLTKFDCIDNSTTAYADFNALWSSSDTANQGGQLNAIVLMSSSSTNSVGKVISGFYSATGNRCNQFSEFAFPPGTNIPLYRVDPLSVSGQQMTVGGAVATGVTLPLPASAAYNALNASVTTLPANPKTYPQTAADFRACPILVRAAMVATCPSTSSTQVPSALASILDPIDASTRCPTATSVQVHIRIEQVYEITGQPKIPTTDTVQNPGATTAIDITRVILGKYGDQCPYGTKGQSGNCGYY